MQGYAYSVFSIAAIAIHLIINFKLLIGRRTGSVFDSRYRGFLLGVLGYYLADGAWGILAGLGWMRLLYVDTVFFFLSLVAFVFLWSRFVISYLDLGERSGKILSGFGYLLWAFNLAVLAVNPVCNCIFHIDADGCYQTGFMRDPAFYLLVVFLILIAAFVFARAVGSDDAVRRRSMMVLLSCATMAAAMILQILATREAGDPTVEELLNAGKDGIVDLVATLKANMQ